LGKPQPSRFAFISSSGPVLVPIQLDQSGDINLYDKDLEIFVVPYDINQSIDNDLKNRYRDTDQ
jgi:hypothetical protein